MIPVMIVDDEKFVRRGIIEDTDWALIDCEVVAEASNGAEALELARQTKPLLVISDINMPKVNGLQLAEKLLAEYPETKVIFLSAYDEFEYARQAVRIGVSDYLLKPYDDGELEASVQRLLHGISLKPKGTIRNRYILNAVEYIESHYQDSDISVGRIAGTIGLSEGHLSRLFKTEMDTGLNTYLTRYRIRQAMRELNDVQIKVYEVAESVGYQDIAYFSNTFKKLVGVTPSDYQIRGI
jgi:YesN/AraC family two-component response regulator